jgi:protein O-GlcNAc transferase
MSRSNKAKPKARPRVQAPVLDAESAALMRLVQAQRLTDAEQAARQILSRRPAHYFALKALSYALISQGRMEEALPILEFAVPRFDRDPELHNNLGIVLSYLMRWDEALACFRRSLVLQPREPEVLKNLGSALCRMNRWDDAVPVLLQAMEHHPGDYIEAIRSLAAALLALQRLDEALVCFRELWQADPDNTYALYNLIAVSLRLCEWQGLAERLAEFRRRNVPPMGTASPFHALAFPGLSGLEHRAIARGCVDHCFPATLLAQEPDAGAGEMESSPRRLRIGFVSADFGEHAVAYVVPRVFESLDRERFEVFGYSIGRDDGSAIRARIVRALDHFVDLMPLGYRAIVERIRADRIDILIDMQGWTAYHREEVFALRCAPVQVNWLGYAGTLGHSRLADYLLGDATATPFEHADCYAEALAHMPHCYLPTDPTRELPAPPGRGAAGLPERGFVFCSFNNSYKLNPDSFDAWCRILRECPDSILWLSSPSPTAKLNLEREAGKRGVDPARLVFASRTETVAQHLARLQLADLALDTFPYNSHSTGIDALWAGVPLVSCIGETFASRVGASMLRAVHLDELVTTDFEQYQALAIDLYRDRDRLAKLRQRLGGDKGRLPLFDMAGFARDMGDVLLRMWQAHLGGRRNPILVQNRDPGIR